MAPSVSIQVPAHGKIGEEIRLPCDVDDNGTPALAYHWNFGDGTTQDVRRPVHTYTAAGEYAIRLTVEGIGGISAEKLGFISVNGTEAIPPARRYTSSK